MPRKRHDSIYPSCRNSMIHDSKRNDSLDLRCMRMHVTYPEELTERPLASPAITVTKHLSVWACRPRMRPAPPSSDSMSKTLHSQWHFAGTYRRQQRMVTTRRSCQREPPFEGNVDDFFDGGMQHRPCRKIRHSDRAGPRHLRGKGLQTAVKRSEGDEMRSRAYTRHVDRPWWRPTGRFGVLLLATGSAEKPGQRCPLLAEPVGTHRQKSKSVSEAVIFT